MTPKKTVKNPSSKIKTTAQKTTKRTVQREKTKFNMPANIKVSIPFTKNRLDDIEMSCRGNPKFKKNLDPETKLQLANEVAMLQLSKEIEVKQEPVKITFKNTKKAKPKRVISDFFKKRVVTDKNNTDAKIALNVSKKPQKKASEEKPPPTNRVVTRKRSASATKQNSAKVMKTETNPHPELDIKIKSEEDPFNSNLTNSNPVADTTVVDPIALPPEPVINPIQPAVRPTKTTRKRQPAKQTKSIMKPPAARKKNVRQGKQDNLVIGGESPPLRDRLRKLSKKEPQTEVEVSPKINPTPGAVGSRKTSTSSNSNLSWTKDISSSSTTTTCITVSSTDFVRIDKKLPVLSLTNIDHKIMKRNGGFKENVIVETYDDSDSDSDTDTSDSDSTDSDKLDDSIDVNSLHLSASSQPSSHLSQVQSKYVSSDYKKAAEKLTMIVKNIDMEIINWISSENDDVDTNYEKFKDKMFDILDNEFSVITHCRRLKDLLDPPKADKIVEETRVPDVVNKANDVNVIQNNPAEETNKDVEFVKPIIRPYRKLSVPPDGENPNICNKVTRPNTPEDDPVGNTTNYSNYDHHDDDDALSLYAESITDSVRMFSSMATVSNTPLVEEYIPQSVKETANVEKQTYCPTKIKETAEIMASKITNICEKQNADSTSIYKQRDSTEDAESYQDFNELNDLDMRPGPIETMKPRLMESNVELMPKTRSVVFGSLCFYNLINSCRKYIFGQCRFIHIIPTNDQIKAKLSCLDEKMFIKEYLLLRNWTDLRRKYGMCYVDECAKRGLTRILIEMAYDFIVKARNDSEQDAMLRIETIEKTLLHLNNVDLSTCEDLLKLCIHADQVNRTLLCDVFMATMSMMQNFSRFKSVFLNLTYFMVDNDRSFNNDVLEHILERVCILPFEEALARALIQMMRLTKRAIFKNSMITHFEKLISVNQYVFEEYSLLKNQCERTDMLASSVMKTDQPLSIRPEGGEGQPPAPSPDTTNLDNLSKTAEEPMQPVITRTIGMNPPIVFNRSQMSPGVHNPTYRGQSSSESSNSDEINKANVRKWRNRSIFPHIKAVHRNANAMHALVRTPPRPPMRGISRVAQRMPFNQRLVTFKSPNNYVNRHPGPQY